VASDAANSLTGTESGIVVTADVAAKMLARSATSQRVHVSTAVAEAPSVIVEDTYDNPVSGRL